MPSKKFKNKNKRNSKYQAPKRERPQHVNYVELVRENKNFEKYYKLQNLVEESKWNDFITTLKADLPSAFRLTGTKSQAQSLLQILKDKFFNVEMEVKPVEVDGKPVKELIPVCLPWYPDGLAWQINLTRRDIRKHETYWRLHQFLISETETGNVSRQEAVSMIPPLLLKPQSHHKVLDMCAAPGSKTAQLIEFLHTSSDSRESAIPPSGIVVANDASNKRCYMLTHQAKRLQSPTIVITNHDATAMPNIHHTRKDGSIGQLKFDRILCDVPCSGDGTLRKNYDVWNKWNVVNGANLHGLQMRIVRRGLEMLNIDGLLVYSTCSLNPLENESVINRVLEETGGAVQLLDVTEQLPGLKFRCGLTHWTICSKDLNVVSSPEHIPPNESNILHKHLFPPNEEQANIRHLNRCIRILPHQQDTGGFFIAVMQKVAGLPGEKIYKDEAVVEGESERGNESVPQEESTNRKVTQPPRKRRCFGFREEPFFYMKRDDPIFSSINEFYSLDDNFDSSLFLTRTQEGRKKNIYFTNGLVKDVVTINQYRMKIINTGVKVLVRCDNKGSLCDFRLAQEGSQVLLPFFTSRKLHLSNEDTVILLLNEDADLPPQIATLSNDVQEQCKTMSCGSAVFVTEVQSHDPLSKETLQLELVGWKGKNSLRAYVARNDRLHFLRIMGADTSQLEKNKFEDVKNKDVIIDGEVKEVDADKCEEDDGKVDVKDAKCDAIPENGAFNSNN